MGFGLFVGSKGTCYIGIIKGSYSFLPYFEELENFGNANTEKPGPHK